MKIQVMDLEKILITSRVLMCRIHEELLQTNKQTQTMSREKKKSGQPINRIENLSGK